MRSHHDRPAAGPATRGSAWRWQVTGITLVLLVLACAGTDAAAAPTTSGPPTAAAPVYRPVENHLRATLKPAVRRWGLRVLALGVGAGLGWVFVRLGSGSARRRPYGDDEPRA